MSGFSKIARKCIYIGSLTGPAYPNPESACAKAFGDSESLIKTEN
jgi:hypothetical protein